MLTQKQVQFLREELQTAKNPLFFYDDDGDGLASFLLLYRMHREGTGVRVTTSSKVDAQSIRKVNELNPDKIFILDIPLLEQEFVDQAKRPVFWIDHHQPQDVKNVHYFNPRIKEPDAYIPTTKWAYQISGNQDDLWIAATGCLADAYLPEFIDGFVEKYPDLLPEKSDLTTMLYRQPLGKLVKMFFFLLKGPNSEVKKSVKVLSRIKSPYEIFRQESSAGKFLYHRFEKINEMYENILDDAKKKATRSNLLLFTYPSTKWSFTAVLANELLAMHPNKVIIIARKKSDEMKCSLRAGFRIVDALEKSLQGVEGYGGGHPQACGAVIKEKDWELFLEKFKEEIKNLN